MKPKLIGSVRRAATLVLAHSYKTYTLALLLPYLSRGGPKSEISRRGGKQIEKRHTSKWSFFPLTLIFYSANPIVWFWALHFFIVRGHRELLDGNLCWPDSKQWPWTSNLCTMTIVKLCWHNFTQSAYFIIFLVSSISYKPTDFSMPLLVWLRFAELRGE